MNRLTIRRALAAGLVALATVGCERPDVDAAVAAHVPEGAAVPLYENLGDHHYEISTSVSLAQRYFDQGLRLYYAFNHQEAIRSFREAQRLDPECTLCWWGEGLAWGPNINLPMDSASAVAAYEATRRALEAKAHGTAREQALVDALATRYAPVPPTNRGHLDEAYANAMASLVTRYPDDHEIAVLRAESLMNLRPWDYWTADGEPAEGMTEALRLLERVAGANNEHPGACHFFIHAVEEVYPERAVPCAERLASLMPGAGHLVHMPGHIYIRVGRYLDAVKANEHAVHADETYIQDHNPAMGMYTAGYYPHNYDFMAFAAMMVGRGDLAVGSAEKVAGLIPEEMFGATGMDFLEHWSVRPLLFQVRFARWRDILGTPAPPETRPHARAIHHYARGRALAGVGDVAGATRELEALRAISDSDALDGMKLEFNPSSDVLGIAEAVLAGHTDAAAGRHDDAVAHLRRAVVLEDGLLYGEPPEWSVPTRQDLGAVLLIAGRAEEAESAFRDDLERFPDNGWSLHGLSEALRAQGRLDDAARVLSELRRVWSTADVDLDSIPLH